MKVDTGLQRVGNEWDLRKRRHHSLHKYLLNVCYGSGHDREEILLGDLGIMGRKEISQYTKENMDTEEKWESWTGIVR